MDTMRSFIAIELPQALRAELGNLQNKLQTPRQTWIKWVVPESVHLTLKFLGDVSIDKIEEIVTAIEEASSEIIQFKLKVQELGVFPNLSRIRVIWVGLTGDLDRLQILQKNIEENMEILGFPAEERKFTPHLTLGRVRFQPPSPDLEKFTRLIEMTKFVSSSEIDVDTVNLMKSELTPKGAIYSKIASIKLKTFS